MVPESSLAKDLCCIFSTTSGNVDSVIKSSTSTELNIFCFFLSLGGSLKTLMIRAEAEDTTSVWVCVFWVVSSTIIFNPSRFLLPWQCHYQPFLDTSLGAEDRHGTNFLTRAPAMHLLIFLYSLHFFIAFSFNFHLKPQPTLRAKQSGLFSFCRWKQQTQNSGYVFQGLSYLDSSHFGIGTQMS